MIDPREERELEAYLAGDSPVSKSYAQGPAAMPPPELDAAILAAAETELKVVPLQRKWRRWGAAVGVAASAVLAVALVLQMTIQPGGVPEVSVPEMLDELLVESAPAPELKAARNVVQSDQAVLPESPADTRARITGELRSPAVQEKEQAGRAVVAKESARPADTRDSAPAGLLEPTPDVAAGHEEELVLHSRRREANLQDEPVAVTAYSAEDADPSLLPAEDFLEAGLPAASMAAPAKVDKSEADGSFDLTAAVVMIRDYQAQGRLATAREDQPARAKAESQASAGQAPTLHLEEIVTTSRKRVEPGAAVASASVERQNAPTDPEQQLAEILRLYDAGELAAADRLLTEFYLQYPAHPVSVSLADGRN